VGSYSVAKLEAGNVAAAPGRQTARGGKMNDQVKSLNDKKKSFFALKKF
jgi:hypothetical protein